MIIYYHKIKVYGFSFLEKLKIGIMRKKIHFFIFLIFSFFLLKEQLFSIFFIFFICACFYFSSPIDGDTLSYSDTIRLRFKRAYLNRKYLRIKRFWRYDFKKAYKAVKWYNLIWQFPLIVLISFYNAISTRYEALSTIYYIRCSLLIFVFQNSLGWVLLLSFFLPLVFISFLCAIPYIGDSLNHTYGKNTLKKLGFNIFNSTLKTQGPKVLGALAVTAAGCGFYEYLNHELTWVIIRKSEAHLLKSYDDAYTHWEDCRMHGRDNLGSAPSYPSEAQFNVIREKHIKDRPLPSLPQLFKVVNSEKINKD